MAEKLRQAYINIILKSDDSQELSKEFLKILTLDELRNLSCETLSEEEL